MSTRTHKPSVKLVAGQAITTSLKVAEAFGKQHKAVLRAIANLDCSEEFNRRNFAPTEYTDSANRKQPMYTITRDGFAFLASGFTGKEAAQWKERYIAAFNELERRAMDKAVAKRLPKPAAQPALPNASIEQLAIERLSKARLMLHFAANGNAVVYQLPRNARVLAAEELADFIRDADMVESKYLPGIISAAAGRLS